MKNPDFVIKDPVCGMTVSEVTAYHAVWDGKTYFFCSAKCQNKFLSDSQKSRVEETPEP